MDTITKGDKASLLRLFASFDDPNSENYADQEGAHVDADQALLAFIGDPDITAAFDAIDKWYA